MINTSAIVSQVTTYLGNAADGTKTLDRAGLTAWLRTQVNTDVTASFVGTTAYPIVGGVQLTASEAIAQSVTRVMTAIEPFMNTLAAVIAPSNWSGRGDWTQPVQSPQQSTAFASAVAAVADASKRVTTQNDTITAGLLARVQDDVFTKIVAPMLPPVVVPLLEDRYYVTTMVTTWGEESAPSPVSSVKQVDQNDTVTISRPTLIYPERLVNRWCIYRTQVGSQGAEFQFVAEVPITDVTYTDSKKGSELQEVLATTTWLPPPSNLTGLTNVSNGILAGFFDNTLCFSVAYKPHAWPIEFQLQTKLPIVGIAGFGSSVFVGTRGSPYIASGADPASMDLTELPSNQACVSSRSIVPVDNGVIYASPDGLCLATASGVTNMTEGLITREDWQLCKPESVLAALYNQCYYFQYDTGSNSAIYMLDFVSKKLTQLSELATALYVDQVTDTLYIVNGTQIQAVFGGATARTGLYRTGIIKLDRQTPMAWLQVDGDYTAPVTLRWYGDGVLRYTATLNNITPVRLPAGRYLEHEIEIESSARVTRVTMASTTEELQKA